MKPLHEWDETDLEKLISDQVQEGLKLDYKQSDSLVKTSSCQTEIAKDVSAFANSAGGRLIYGIVEANNLPIGIDGGADPVSITREWIENTIISRIQPRIPGIVIKPIPLAAGGNAFVIDIPQATTFARIRPAIVIIGDTIFSQCRWRTTRSKTRCGERHRVSLSSTSPFFVPKMVKALIASVSALT